MDLLNATGEMLAYRYDGIRYEIPPNELTRVSDDCGRHLLRKLAQKGLQEVYYGRDPLEISFAAIKAIVSFHEKQIAIHEDNNEQQTEKKFQLLPEPQGVKEARARLKVYKPIYERLAAKLDEQQQEELKAEMTGHLEKSIDLPNLDDMDIETLRETLKNYGGDPKQKGNRKKLIKEIRKLKGEVDDDVPEGSPE